jgi:hypothetical protein
MSSHLKGQVYFHFQLVIKINRSIYYDLYHLHTVK